MLRPETDSKIAAITNFLRNNKKNHYSLSFDSCQNSNKLDIPVYSEAEMLNIAVNVNFQIGFVFFDNDHFKNLSIAPEKPLHILIESFN